MPTKTKLTDLNEHLFEQIERLNDEDKKGDELKEEIERANAISGVAKRIIENARLVLDAEKAIGDRLIDKLPPMIGNGEAKNGKEK